ncbi:MAG: outer membrane beta-barrel protein [Flavipsychrobacter sp.]|nr:outer membrane beta-barrel protein [Flavipsychrobacter sp.]
MKKTITAVLVLTTAFFSPKANAQATVEGTVELSTQEKAPAKEVKEKIPWDGYDQTWVNGNDRRDSSVFHIPFFTPSILIDCNATHSFNSPIDHTVVGSTALARNDEMVISAINIGGDFNYGNARGRIMTQFGARSQVVPRNDLSPYRGQYDLADAYRYLDEAYAGYHFNVWYGINVDAGLFMSYIGLNSYYQQENWEYQASFTSDNTPWFFNGIRIQIFPTKNLKIEPWIINGWQSYGSFNSLPGLGTNITYIPKENIKMLTNDYYGTDAAGLLGRHRFHSDNSFLWRYYNHPKSKGISRMALSITGDIGYEKGDGVNGFTSDAVKGPAQYFESWMVYDKIWFHKNKMGVYFGGGWMTNPGRYLVLAPTGDASPFPNPYNPTQTVGTHPFTENPGDKFTGWDCSIGFSWTPNQSIEFKAEYVHREADVPYFAGPGGVTSPSGYTYTPIPTSGWAPDLVKSENRVIFAALFRL